MDSVSGIPFPVQCTRIVVYFAGCSTKKDEILSPLVSSEELYVQRPDIVLHQDFTSASVEPHFEFPSDFRRFITGESTCVAVVVVECARHKGWFTYGHAVLPISSTVTKHPGNYFSRLRPGDPRVTPLQ